MNRLHLTFFLNVRFGLEINKVVSGKTNVDKLFIVRSTDSLTEHAFSKKSKQSYLKYAHFSSAIPSI